MRIAIDIPDRYPPVWEIAAGALEYETAAKYSRDNKDLAILLPHASRAGPEDCDVSNWDAAIVVAPKRDLDIPQVIVNSGFDTKHPTVTPDDQAVAGLAVDQFVSMGLRTLAYFGRSDWVPSRERWRGFSQRAESAGLDPVYISSRGEDWPRGPLRDLPKPCGILAFNDTTGLRLMRICRRLGFEVPRDVQVIAIDNTPACMKSTPTLSSIAIPFTLVGYHAAELCEKMVNGESVASIQVPPSGLIIRDSIDFDREDIRTAASIAHYLRTNIAYPIQMEDVVRRSSLARRRLEQTFRSAYGVSPMAYLRGLRIEKVKEMLRSSDAPLKEIAKQCGFSNDIYLCQIFKKKAGLSPMAYRETQAGAKGPGDK